MKNYTQYLLLMLVTSLTILSCKTEDKKQEAAKPFNYEAFKDSVINKTESDTNNTSNIFDDGKFVPGKDSLETMLVKIDTQWKREASFMDRYDTIKKKFTNNPGFSPEEKEVIATNIKTVDSFLISKKDTTGKIIACKEKECMVYAVVDKANQKLYLWLMGELKDSFLVSTGKGKKYDTPQMSLHPEGPIVTKYTSKKFPGGNYLGLGNMPYAVFLRDGYAIHGTTPGSFAKLGTPASHGCVRLHPDNAKVFNAIVKSVGLNQTWVSIKDSLPK